MVHFTVFLSCHIKIFEWINTLQLPECQGTHCLKQARYLKLYMTERIQMHHRGKYWQHSSIIEPVWLYGWVFVYKLSGCGFKSHCSHLNFRYRTCLEEGVPWHFHSKTYMWHDKNTVFTSQFKHHQILEILCSSHIHTRKKIFC